MAAAAAGTIPAHSHHQHANEDLRVGSQTDAALFGLV